jgi:hut operon positive regulator
MLLDLAEGAEVSSLPGPYRVGLGRVGTMETQSIYAAVLACAERSTVLDPGLNDVHALYHATRDALDGVLRDSGGLGPTLRTVALLFTIVRGPRIPGLDGERDWIAVAMFGSVGAPRSGWEHDAVGLGISNL